MNLLHEQFALITTQFHWLRPLWLLSLIPVLLLSIFLWRQKNRSHQWQHLIAPELLPYLMDSKTTTTRKSLLWVLILAWLFSAVALAGPSWVKRPSPIEKNQDALVILLDLSISMISEDIKPSRIVRARLKIADILRNRKDGQTALVVYAGDAHTVTPLSDDNATIVSLLPSLQPNIMPSQGSNTEAAVERGIRLLHDAGATQGTLLLVTDGVVPEAFPAIKQLLANKNIHLDILGVGSNQPAPMASGKGGFIRDQQGNIITTQLNSSELSELAKQTSGRYSDIANTDKDISYLTAQTEKMDGAQKATVKRDFDQWFDQGYWLVFLILPIVLFSFKRGFLLTLVFIPLLGLTPTSSYAFSMEDMWLTKDQQAQRALSAGDAKKAAEQFKSPDWKAASQYRAGDYAAAAESFSRLDSANAHYNRGNALAKSGKFEEAIKAYDEALKRDNNLEDAKKNRALVEKALNDKKQQEKSDKDNKDQNNQEKDQKENDQEKNDQEKSDQDKNSQEENESQGSKDPDEQSKHQSKPEGNQQSSQQSSVGDANTNGQNSSSGNKQPSESQGQQSSSAANTTENQAAANSSSATQPENDEQQTAQPGEVDPNSLNDEQKQALEQWLRRVPDDPGGLLRNKFNWQYQQNRHKKSIGEFEPPKNNADQRW